MTQQDKGSFTKAIMDHFDTFSALHTVTVIKEPQKIILDNTIGIYAGYESTPNLNNVTYVTVSGIFPCMVFSQGGDFANVNMLQVPVRLQKADKIIKVDQTAKNFIQGSQVSQLILDNNEIFTLSSEDFAKNYANVTYYYFIINKTA